MARDNGTQMWKTLDSFARKNQHIHRRSVCAVGQEFHENREDLLRNARKLDCRAVQRSHQQLAVSAGVLLVVVVGLVDFLGVEKFRREIYYIFGIDLLKIGSASQN